MSDSVTDSSQERRDAAKLGVSGDLALWIDVNLRPQADGLDLRETLAPFPPPELMSNTTGLTRNDEFASHGAAILVALAACSPKPLGDYRSLLDFGVGVGRLARMFKGFGGRYVGVDVDARHIDWVSESLDYVDAIATAPREPLPFPPKSFDGVVSISVFTHMNEDDHKFYLSELVRVTKPGAYLFLTLHGERALRRAETQPPIFEMLSIPATSVAEARKSFTDGPGYTFVPQAGHLTSDEYQYGITFVSEDYVRAMWSEYFTVIQVASGAIHDFQDIVVLKREPD
jgi:SAM-dependent methyltransferase